MAKNLSGKIFTMHDAGEENVTFFRVMRATTNTCEVVKMRKSVVYQTEDYQFVEPGKELEEKKTRCKVIDLLTIKFKSGDIAHAWDGKPVRQTALVYLWTY